MKELTLRELLIAWNTSNGYNSTGDNDDLYDDFENCMEEVWEGNYDEHRWYTLSDVVRKVPDGSGGYRYFSDQNMNTVGDNSREDCGWEVPDIDTLEEVFPKEVLKTVYVTKENL